MKWKNTLKDKPPEHNQEVLISVDGVYYIAIYDDKEKVFRVQYKKLLIFPANNHLIYWTEFYDPQSVDSLKD
jgi:hypothetical protein